MFDHSLVPQTRPRLILPALVLGLGCRGGLGKYLEVPVPYKLAHSDHTRGQSYPLGC